MDLETLGFTLMLLFNGAFATGGFATGAFPVAPLGCWTVLIGGGLVRILTLLPCRSRLGALAALLPKTATGPLFTGRVFVGFCVLNL